MTDADVGIEIDQGRGSASDQQVSAGNLVRWNRTDRTEQPVRDTGRFTRIQAPDYVQSR